MIVLRLIGKAFLVSAFLALAFDGSHAIATPGVEVPSTSLLKLSQALGVSADNGLNLFVSGSIPQFLWTMLVEPAVTLPLSLVCAVLGIAFFLAGYRRPPPAAVTG